MAQDVPEGQPIFSPASRQLLQSAWKVAIPRVNEDELLRLISVMTYQISGPRHGDLLGKVFVSFSHNGYPGPNTTKF